MHKRLLLTILALTLAVFPVGKSGAQAFRDVNTTRYADAYASLSGKGAVEGFRDGSGRPQQVLTRAEALKVVLAMRPEWKTRVDWFSHNLPPLPLYIDVVQRAWYAPYVEAAFEQGIITGYPDRMFRPGAPLLAEEGIVLLLRAYDEDVPAGGGERRWFDRAVARAFALNIIAPGEGLRLGDTLTRGQFFDMVYRLDTVRSQGLAAFVEPTHAPVVAAAAQPAAVPASAPRTVPTVRKPVTSPTSSPSAPSVPPLTAPVAQGSVTVSQKPFSITIPALGIQDLSVMHPTDPTTSKGLLLPLQSGLGHLFSYPGGGGKIMVYGHSSGYPWDISKYTKIFRTVNGLKEGDRVYVTYRGKLFVYEVTAKETIDAADMKPFSGEGEELILYTCWPPDSIKQRYIVRAMPVSSVAAR